MACTFVYICKQEHLFEKVEIIVGSHTIRTQRNIDTTLEHFRYARKAARKLHIADATVTPRRSRMARSLSSNQTQCAAVVG